ncbi:unnamed protein product [Thlaspi arvense]|uniref:Uncharacterized protein n=1 Tax=Thlaspi arvense TaxID=13288 RepID=A0AAU9RUT1_THLAR|nr:unnamed protein product [Thlaspi arvense]
MRRKMKQRSSFPSTLSALDGSRRLIRQNQNVLKQPRTYYVKEDNGNCSDSEIRECLHESYRDDIHVLATEENGFIFLKNFVTATDI